MKKNMNKEGEIHMNMRRVKQELKKSWIGDIEYYSRHYLGTKQVHLEVKTCTHGTHQIEKNQYWYYDSNFKRHNINKKSTMINYIIKNLTREQFTDYLKWFGIVG